MKVYDAIAMSVTITPISYCSPNDIATSLDPATSAELT